MLHPACALSVFLIISANYFAYLRTLPDFDHLVLWQLWLWSVQEVLNSVCPNDVFVLLATTLILAEPFYRDFSPIRTSLRFTSVWTLVFCVAYASFIFGRADCTRIGLLVSLAAVTLVRCFDVQKNYYHLHFVEIASLNSDDLFFKWNAPFTRFGRLGGLLVAAIVLDTVVELYPSLLALEALRYVTYVVHSVAALGLIVSPGFFGGTVQFVKYFALKN
ncbi:hypothetical protein L596_022793 [Steinernema carpocapsae]|uniref:Uncharacterized protein n=1 Tax=Steinernema carpocapsae TaxID=34508 RepID=A0A4U5MMP1_STECR|nr:hypothetical protein L596_022793 [Steinernema carpocapsae]